MKLRSYQLEGLRRLSAEYQAGKRSVCFVLPTGGGKTACFSYVHAAHLRSRPEAHVLVTAHRQELVDQAASEMERFGLKCRKFARGRLTGPQDARVTVAMIQSLMSAERFPCAPTHVTWDEGHHAPADSYQFVKSRVPQGCRHLFVTATPERLDGKPMGDVCDAMVIGCQAGDLIRYNERHPGEGLLNCVVDAPGSRKKAGVQAEFASDAILRLAQNEKTVIFAPNREYSLAEVQKLRDAGVKAAHVDGNTPAQARSILLDRLKNGDLQVISSINLLTEGWNLPSLECAVIARSCESPGMYLQICGRVMRPFGHKRWGHIIDLTGAYHRHGLPSEDREYALDGTAIRRATQDDQLPPAYRCRECLKIFPRKGADCCPFCGATMEHERTKLEIDGEKVERITAMQAANRQKGDEWAKTKMVQFLREAEAKKYKPGWAIHRMRLIGVDPSRALYQEAMRAL